MDGGSFPVDPVSSRAEIPACPNCWCEPASRERPVSFVSVLSICPPAETHTHPRTQEAPVAGACGMARFRREHLVAPGLRLDSPLDELLEIVKYPRMECGGYDAVPATEYTRSGLRGPLASPVRSLLSHQAACGLWT